MLYNLPQAWNSPEWLKSRSPSFLEFLMPCLLPFSSSELAHPSIYAIWHGHLPRPAIQMRCRTTHPSIKHATMFLGFLILWKVTTLVTGHSGYGGSANPQNSSRMRFAHKTGFLAFCTIHQWRKDYLFCHGELSATTDWKTPASAIKSSTVRASILRFACQGSR